MQEARAYPSACFSAKADRVYVFGGENVPSHISSNRLTFTGTVEWLAINEDEATWAKLRSDSLDFMLKGRLNQAIAPLDS